MNWILFLATLSVSEKDLIDLARFYNRGCLEVTWCQQARGKYFEEEALRPIISEILVQSRDLGISPLWMMAYIQEQSEFVSDAVSRYNKVKPHPTHPWEKPPPGRKNWCGLDFGIAQIHTPSIWGKCHTSSQIEKFKDPVHSIRILANWIRYRMDFCKRNNTKMCREMYMKTGVLIHRRLVMIPRFMRIAAEFLQTRVAIL